jgi:hypothetical protein
MMKVQNEALISTDNRERSSILNVCASAMETTKSTTSGACKSNNPLRLLVNKQVFLDLNRYKHLTQLRKCLSLIGAVCVAF